MTLGIDTSNYTTSCALFGGSEPVSRRKLLDVKEGRRGIRQSEGVFIHNRELPPMLEELLRESRSGIAAVGASVTPRSVEGSYMPVFTVGAGCARIAAAALGARYMEFSHQDGHIMAGIYSAAAPELLKEPFISVHLSGGTTEILRTEYNGYNFDCEIVGGTLDISAGQLIDRVGVAMGLKFPCGRALEELAEQTDRAERLPVSTKGARMNFSGAETRLIRSADGADPSLARTVLCHIARTLVKTVGFAARESGLRRVLFVGGVASNGIIRSELEKLLDADIYFASKELSTDNAIGIAALAAAAQNGRG